MKKKAKSKFNLFDYFWFAVGVVVSIVVSITDHEHSFFYTLSCVISLNSAIVTEILAAKGRRICHIFSVVAALSYGLVAWINKYYGGAISNILFYAPVAIVGFYLWGKNSNKKKEVIARKLSITQIIVLIIAIIASTFGLNIILKYYGGNATILDSFSTVLIPIASILGVLRYRETWVIWFISDIVILAMWTDSPDILILTQRIFYPIVAIYAYFSWDRLLKKPSTCKK